MTFRNFLQRCWFAKTELNNLAGLGRYFKNHSGHFSENPIKMSPSDHWFILTALHAWQIWYFKTFLKLTEKKKQHRKKGGGLFDSSGLCGWLYSLGWGGTVLLASSHRAPRIGAPWKADKLSSWKQRQTQPAPKPPGESLESLLPDSEVTKYKGPSGPCSNPDRDRVTLKGKKKMTLVPLERIRGAYINYHRLQRERKNHLLRRARQIEILFV